MESVEIHWMCAKCSTLHGLDAFIAGCRKCGQREKFYGRENKKEMKELLENVRVPEMLVKREIVEKPVETIVTQGSTKAKPSWAW